MSKDEKKEIEWIFNAFNMYNIEILKHFLTDLI